jgi:hypothetical protein
MDILEKLATQGTQDEEKRSKNTTQYALDTAMRKPTYHKKTIAKYERGNQKP